VTGPRTSEFTEEDEPPIEIPEPQQRCMDVPEGSRGNKTGQTILAKKCAKMGYDTRLTYARGYVVSQGALHLRHSLVLRISRDGEPVAAAIWEAPALEGDDPWDAPYKPRGALIKPLAAKVGNKQLEEWLLDPTTDPRDTYLKEANV
jgi:hypothetical protein